MRNYIIEVVICAENKSDAIERIEDIDKDCELEGYTEIRLFRGKEQDISLLDNH